MVEARLIRLNCLFSVLSKINETIVRIRDREKLFKEACRIVVEEGGFKMSWIGVVDPSTLLVKPTAHCCGEYEGSYIDGLVVSVKDVPEGQGPIGNVIRGGKHVICNNIESDPSMALWRDKALRYGYRSSAAFPLRQGTDVIGTITVYSGEPFYFNKEEVELLDTLAADLSFAIESIEVEKEAMLAKENLLQSNTLLKTISRAQSEFISDIDPQVLFAGLLKDLLALTGSEYGFIGETFYNTDGSPYLKTHAITNIAWNDETRALYDKIAPAFEFRNLKSLFGEVMTTGKPVISNNPATDPRRCGIPEGHPPLNAFLGLPFYSGNELTGMVGIANSQNGYDEGVVEYLQPFLSTCSNIIAAYRVKKQHLEAEEKQKKIEDVLWNTANGVSAETGEEFFVSLVKYLGKTLGVDYAFIGQLTGKGRNKIRTIALYAKGKIADNFEYDLEGTPCMTVVGKEPCSYPDGLQELFPDDHLLVDMGINCYIGMPLFDSSGSPVGLMSVMDGKRAEDPEMTKSILQIFAARAAAEMERKGMEEEKKKVEKQLLQSQKMEAVGQLAGGIAHDFNNALTAILGFGKLLLMKRGDDELIKNYAQHIVDAGESAASLVKGILAFSRKQTIIPQPIDIAELARNVKKILLRLIGEDIEIRTSLPDSSMIVKADPTQIEQVLMNLATNARDAMQDGGVITIGIEPLTIDDGFVKAHGFGEPGNYVLLSFADTGVGMDEETRKKIFEPLFTTKEVGKGTGLGLASVYGIVKQHGGFINVYSEPGKGTTLRIYLPLMQGATETGKSREVIIPQRGTETLLLVEDDESVRELTLTVLEDFGYNVIVAVDGEDGIRKFKEYRDKIHLCISDMVMPKKNGREAVKEMRKIRPDLRVIFMSGYAPDKTMGIIEEGLDFISKPVSPSELLRKVREVLDR